MIFGLGGQRAGDADPLALAAGERRRQPRGEVVAAGRPGRAARRRARAMAALSQPASLGVMAMFSATRHVRKEADLLEDVADPPAQRCGRARPARARPPMRTSPASASIRPLMVFKRRGLARARAAEQGGERSRLDRQRHAVHGRQRAVALDHALQLDDRLGHAPPATAPALKGVTLVRKEAAYASPANAETRPVLSIARPARQEKPGSPAFAGKLYAFTVTSSWLAAPTCPAMPSSQPCSRSRCHSVSGPLSWARYCCPGRRIRLS